MNKPMPQYVRNLMDDCHALQDLLVADQVAFASNDHAALMQNGVKKQHLLGRISLKLDQHAVALNNLPEEIRSEIKTAVQSCLQDIATNSLVVNTNLARVKTIWKKLKPEEVEVYDAKGKIL